MTIEDRHGIERRLDREHAGRLSDGLLSVLAMLGNNGMPVGVGLIVDGIAVRGFPTSPETFSAALDKALLRIVDIVGSNWDPEVKKSLADPFSQLIARRRTNEAAARAVVERVMAERPEGDAPSIDEIELDDIEDFYRATEAPRLIELQNAKFFSAGDWVEVGSMRVDVSHIAAWWPMDEEAGAEVNYVDNSEVTTDANQD